MPQKNQYMHDLETVGHRASIQAELPWLIWLLNKLPIDFANQTIQMRGRLHEYSKQSIEWYWNALKADPEHVKPTLLTKGYAAFENGTLDIGQLQRDGAGYIIAGTETTALALMYTTWLLAQHPDCERILIEEVCALRPDYTDEYLKHLPYLQHVYHESPRLRGPVAQCLPRVVLDNGAEFGGYYLPASSIVGVSNTPFAAIPISSRSLIRSSPRVGSMLRKSCGTVGCHLALVVEVRLDTRI
jgi:cytochrome P450